MVDDARTWGRIAAANSISDVYAMGGRPLFALNLVGWNTAELPTTLLSEVLAGADEIAAESGFVIVGGHTVDDPEPKYGLAVVGEVHPDRVLTNAGVRADQVLVLTKPLGIGVVATAVKQDAAPADVTKAAVTAMTTTNAYASAAAVAAHASGATDITGFGLLGHLARMVEASSVDAVVEVARVPLLPGVRTLAEEGMVPGGTRRNLEWSRSRLTGAEDLDETTLLLLADAQTSGGLLFAAPPEAAERAVAELVATGGDAIVIGRTEPGPGRIHLR